LSGKGKVEGKRSRERLGSSKLKLIKEWETETERTEKRKRNRETRTRKNVKVRILEGEVKIGIIKWWVLDSRRGNSNNEFWICTPFTATITTNLTEERKFRLHIPRVHTHITLHTLWVCILCICTTQIQRDVLDILDSQCTQMKMRMRMKNEKEMRGDCKGSSN